MTDLDVAQVPESLAGITDELDYGRRGVSRGRLHVVQRTYRAYSLRSAQERFAIEAMQRSKIGVRELGRRGFNSHSPRHCLAKRT
jgi:hypothetical protein